MDTNIFNRILDGKLEIQTFQNSGFQFFATHVQKDELEKTPNAIRRKELLEIFQNTSTNLATESALWGKSKWGQAKWAKDDLVSEIIRELDKIEKKKNNKQDALIADTAIKNKMTLLTEDGPLYDVAKQFGGNVERLKDFIKFKRMS